ncbi:hypothetical protein [Solitalea koreensis]|uniref:Four helix bundle protein n=1 Tax=Solitalea koreensis TaxID=543615 RepID=A0A521D275_9SPHI|nr:hypothetical protein [Solitalea koreensis]SMO65752.1 hypothetical protein SAMN06265350_105162 [Solitalea koreensis]
MFDDEDNDFDFNEEDFDPSEFQREQERIHNLPVYKKAMEIAAITQAICESIDPKKDDLDIRSMMLQNAYVIGSKISGAEGGDLFTLRMENAVIIKIHARELLAQTSLCQAEGLSNNHYLQILRDEIEQFKLLFIEWVKSFDKTNDIKDDWGLFYD